MQLADTSLTNISASSGLIGCLIGFQNVMVITFGGCHEVSHGDQEVGQEEYKGNYELKPYCQCGFQDGFSPHQTIFLLVESGQLSALSGEFE